MRGAHLKQFAQVLAAAMLWILALIPAVQAAALPEDYPAAFQGVGTVDWIDPSGNALVIGDRTVVLANNIEIHSVHGPTGKYALRKGTLVGIKYVDTPHGKDVTRTVTEIWILPAR